ncbi:MULTISPECIES: response regulator transcription factor [Pontibacillus]|uniref:Response regulator transcription factor n=1 Tax=Pontibacillus chungwhensis TaxID=265426 RepID=A0ABY8UV08_9BACI|nr:MULTISPECIES: response regulator transcription factor [Pontibacillus]MCD5323769.1 response regulator transcription factor [Pontibacillus sp. HN14]WIF97133.1 response regulator transcription factor [Pontibacillus chungwhensis]
MINILIVDDHPAVGMGTKAMLEQEADMEVEVISDSLKAEHQIKEHAYDVLLLDLYMPGLNGVELAKRVKTTYPDMKVLIYTGFDISTHFNLLVESNISGFVSKTATKDQLVTAIHCALREEVVVPLHLFKQLRRAEATTQHISSEGDASSLSLNEKEQKILIEVSKGLTNKHIAQNLHMSQRSVEYTLTGIFSKLEVRSRTEALIRAKELGLISQS